MIERLSVKCDDRAKKLLKEETLGVMAFNFTLSSTYVVSKLSPNMLNFKKYLMIYIPLAQSQEYLQHNLHS